MANLLYNKGREGFLDGTINWATGTIKAVLVASGYTVDAVNDEVLADVPGGQIVATSAAMSGKATADGIADADNLVFSAVAGADIHFIVVYEDSGDPATSRLIAFIDTATGLPLSPDGGDITIAWDSGPNKIFVL